MNAFLARASIDRSARHVGRMRLRTPDRRKQPHVQMLVEESLRLTSLPGEDQGRLYCLRRLRLPALDEHTTPSQWTARCGQQLIAAAHLAARAADPAAGDAEGVFFDDVQQPFRLLVTRLLRGEPAREWFWPQATNVAVDRPAAERLQEALEQWHAQPAGWSGVARELLPVLDRSATKTLVEILRPSMATRWLAPWIGTGAAASRADNAPPLRTRSRSLLRGIRFQFGAADPRVFFFALLAVLEASPASSPTADVLLIVIEAASRELIEDVDAATPSAIRPDGRVPDAARSRSQTRSTDTAAPIAKPSRTSQRSAATRAQDLLPLEDPGVDEGTEYAGLYFLLRVLDHLGIGAALDAHAELTVTHFVTRVLLRIATRAGVDRDDPILRPLLDDLADLPSQSAPEPIVMPPTLAGLRRVRPAGDVTERLWACAVNRWCRRVARVSIAEIVKRPGRVQRTAVSIDVRLPMSAVDLRVRRAGLDIDPGYLPWFGRVVHFHYFEGAV